MMRADDPQPRLHNQALHTKCAVCLAVGTKLVASFMRESEGEPWTCAVEGESDVTEHQNKNQGKEEPPPLDGNTVGVCSLVLGRSTVKASAGPRDHEAQPGLLSARCVSLGSA
jgi:hypothetical protein